MKKIFISLILIFTVSITVNAQIYFKEVSEQINDKNVIVKYADNGFSIDLQDFNINMEIFKKGNEAMTSPLSTNIQNSTFVKDAIIKVLGKPFVDSLIQEGKTGFSFIYYILPNGTIHNLTLVIGRSTLVDSAKIDLWLRLYVELLKAKFDILRPDVNAPYFRHGFGYSISYFKDIV